MDQDAIQKVLDQGCEIAILKAENVRLRDALEGLTDGLDRNTDFYSGLTQAEWDSRVANARKVLNTKESQ